MTTKSKLSNSYRVHFENFGTDDAAEHLTYQVTRITRPGVVFFDVLGMDEFDMPHIEIDLNDDASDRTRAEVVRQLRKQISDNAKFSLVIETLSEERTVIEQWHLSHCRIVECRFGELKSHPAESLRIHLTVQSKRISVVQFGEMMSLLP